MGKCLSRNIHSGKLSRGKLSEWETVVWEIVRWETVGWETVEWEIVSVGNCRVGNCHGTVCVMIKCDVEFLQTKLINHRHRFIPFSINCEGIYDTIQDQTTIVRIMCV